MSLRFNQGEFIYLPASTFIYKFSPATCNVFLSQKKTEKPMYLMFLKGNPNNPSYYDIFFEGSVWSVNSDDVYGYNREGER